MKKKKKKKVHGPVPVQRLHGLTGDLPANGLFVCVIPVMNW